MGVKVDVINSDQPTTVTVSTAAPLEVIETANATVEVSSSNNEPVVVEVLKGLPGVQNLYVGYTPPDNPEEGFVWIDLNG